MQKVLKHIWLIVATSTLVLLSGCSLISLDDFTLLDVHLVEMEGVSQARLELTIENRSCFKVRITSGELAVVYLERELGRAVLQNEVVLPRRSTSTVTVNVGLEFSSPLAMLRAARIISQNPNAVTVSATARVCWILNRMERKNVPISKFIDIFGSPSDYL